MKQLLNSPVNRFIILPIAFLTLIGCNNSNSSKEEIKTTDTTTVSNTDNDQNKKETDIKEKLANLAPLEGEELKKLLPQQILGASAENLDYSSSTGANVATADYKINDSTKVQLSLVDCSGPAGSGFYATQYQDRVTSNGAEGMSIIPFKGSKAILESSTNAPETSLTWFEGNRYLLTLYGEKLSSDELKRIAQNIDIK